MQHRSIVRRNSHAILFTRPLFMVQMGVFLAVSIQFAGCRARPDPDPHRVIASHLDIVETHVTAYGSMMASGVILLQNEGQFRVELDRPVNEYIDAARVGAQAAARSAHERLRESSNALRLTVPIDQLFTGLGIPGFTLPQMTQGDQDGQENQEEQVVQVKEGGDSAERPAMGERTPLKASERLSASLPIGPLPASLSERQALTLGVNDKVTERLLRLLLDPGATISKDEVVYLALMQVSVNPGTKTRTGHVAELTMSAYFAREVPKDPNDSKEDSSAPNRFKSSRTVDLSGPRVVSVYPSVDAQVIDQRRSVREESSRALELATILSALGAKAESEALRREAERLENDLVTRTPMPLVSAFSAGAAFGYQVLPPIQAAATSRGRGGPIETREMYPTTFPALVLVIINRSEYEKAEDESNGWTHLELMVSSRWFPIDGRWGSDRKIESRRLEVAMALDKALAGFGKIPCCMRSGFSAQELLRRFESLSIAALGRTWYMPVRLPERQSQPKPPAKDVEVSEIAPQRGWANAETMLAIQGSGFKSGERSNISAVLVGGAQCQHTVVDDGVLLALVPANVFLGEDGQPIESDHKVSVITKRGIVEKEGFSIRFDLLRRQAPTPPRITLGRDAKDGHVTQITIEPSSDLDARAMLEALRDILRRERVSADVTVTFDVESQDAASR